MSQLTVQAAAALLRERDGFLILTHRRPDGDTTGCAAGLCLALRRLGKTAWVLRNPETTDNNLTYVRDLWAPEGYEPGFVVSVDVAARGLFYPEAEAYFDRQIERLEPILEQESTGKTVAFFSVASNGSVTVRKSGDYIAKAIELAGGVYVFQGLAENENALSTINIQMETFYDTARDADVLIYNSTIEADLDTIEQLVAKSAPLADFKAVQAGNVWCTGKSMFQESQAVGDIITDIHTVVSEEDPADEALTYLRKLT